MLSQIELDKLVLLEYYRNLEIWECVVCTEEGRGGGRDPSGPWAKKYTMLTMATSQKLKFDDVSSGLYFFRLFAQCISQNIKKYKILDTLRKSSFWEVAVRKNIRFGPFQG